MSQDDKDIFERLVQAARVQGRWARMLDDNATKAEMNGAAEVIKDWMAKQKLSINNLAQKTGMGRSTISQVLSGTYKGDRLARLKELCDLMDHEAKVAEVVRPDGLVQTQGVELMIGLIENVHVSRTIGVIIAPPGFSKTTVLQAVHTMEKNSILVEADPKNCNANGLIRLIAEFMGINLHMNSIKQFAEIKRTLRGSGRLLMIDQAHELRPDAFNIIRTINDLKVPVVLAATHLLRERIQALDDTQFSSRVFGTLPLDKMIVMGDGGEGGPAHSVEDIIRICEGGKLRFTADARDFLFRLGNHPTLGALRQCHLLVMAVAQAGHGVEKPISAAILNNALKKMHGEDYRKFVQTSLDRSVLPRVATA
ncbi:MAG: AAA family ATPase [Phycisphaerales bacterium]|nr:AAA family ATPase [Phycisphaerales bacterium]